MNEQEKKAREIIEEMLPNDKPTKDLIIKELIKIVEIISDVRGFSNSTNAPFKFLDSQYSTDEEFLEELKKWNKSYSSQVGFDNPETFVMLSALMIAQQICDSETFGKFLESYNHICKFRKLHSFQKV